MNIADLERFEQKLREAETKLGIKPGHGVPVVYDRSLNAPELILFLFLAGLLALAYFGRSKGGSKSPISLDMFVSIRISGIYMSHEENVYEILLWLFYIIKFTLFHFSKDINT